MQKGFVVPAAICLVALKVYCLVSALWTHTGIETFRARSSVPDLLNLFRPRAAGRDGIDLGGSAQPTMLEALAVPPMTYHSCPNYSPTFPSMGGPDCTFPCRNGTRSVGTAFYNIFPDSYNRKIAAAGDLVRSIDPEHVVYTEGYDPRSAMNGHISFSYYCCHDEATLKRIRRVLETWQGWTPHAVRLAYATCAIDGPALDHVSFVVMLDEDSNRQMMAWVQELEAAIAHSGVKLHLPRRYQEAYHTTLAVVNGSAYPVLEAIDALNKHFPPGSWLEEPLALVKPCAAHGDTPEGFFC